MVFHKPIEYIETIYNVSVMLSNKAANSNDPRLKAISQVIKSYARSIIPIRVDITKFNTSEYINMVPFFEYVSLNKIEFYDFNKMTPDDIDVSKVADIERYALTHIYYITQK